MKKVSVLLALLISFCNSFSQFLNPTDFNEHVWKRFDASLYNASGFFDSCEIMKRKIKSAALLQVYDGTSAFDTLFIYYFDGSGRAFAQVSFTAPSLDGQGDSYVRDKVYDLNSRADSEKTNRNVYTAIHYTPYGVERKSYNIENDEMLDSEFIVTLNCGEAYIQTNERSELIAYRLEEGSSLIGRMVSIQINEDYFATEYVIKYLYN